MKDDMKPWVNLTDENVEVLPPETSLPAVRVDHTPDAVLSQYKRAISGTLEIIRFGAMLIEIDTCLTREIGATKRYTNTGAEPSLKGWMEENCPDINYKTAIRYKTLAQGLQDMFKIPAKLPLTLALPASDGTPNVYVPDTVKVSAERVKKIQMQVWEMVEGKSARQLTFDFGLAEPKPRGGKREGAGRPKALSDSVLAAGAAWGRIGPLIDRATAWHFERFLPQAMCREAIETVSMLLDALNARMAEFGKER